MTTDFDTFCESQFGVGYESRLGVRGCAEEDCVTPQNVLGQCCWENGDCFGCAQERATACYGAQRLCEDQGHSPCRYEWTPYKGCGSPWPGAGVPQFWCGIPQFADLMWNACEQDRGWCCHDGVAYANISRDVCVNYVDPTGQHASWHGPGPQPTCTDPILPCCIYTYHGMRCYNTTEESCISDGGVVTGELGASCDSVSCPAPSNAWGACCSGDGTCTERIKPEDCYVQLGTLWYACQTCDETSCYNGACCLDDGTCEDGITATACHVLGGVFQGPATICDDPEVDCAADIRVACCRPDGTCHDSLSRRHCAAADGVDTGELSCADVSSCPTDFGACCIDFGEEYASCRTEIGTNCIMLGGKYFGHGSRCSQTDCFEGYGICCKMDRFCQEWPSLFRLNCVQEGDVFIGYGAKCRPFACEGSLGACCFPGRPGGCTHTPERICDPMNFGIWQGPGTMCDSVLCPEDTGACCAADGSCYLTWQHKCDNDGGSFQGAGTICDIVDCGSLSTCCLPDGSCIRTGLRNCRAQGGAWNPEPDQHCRAGLCNSGSGACCISDRCWDNGGLGLDYLTCIDQGGKFFGDGSDCEWVKTNCTPGACCLPDGSCEFWTKAWCENRGGEWHGSYGDFFVNCRGHDGTDHAHDYDCSEN